ncbi:MAG: hypothetical protein M1379_00115 [Firmicutes bacterium]|nr:hypothetical protein [Bacillota bacterium]
MDIAWYSFEESYLLTIDYQISRCKLILEIDARMSVDHPKALKARSFEERFAKIKMVFDGVQYFESINSTNLLNNPNEDLGSIHSLSFKKLSDLDEGLIGVKQEANVLKLALYFQDGNTAEVYSKINGIQFSDFVSEMLAFRVGFEHIEICEIRDE